MKAVTITFKIITISVLHALFVSAVAFPLFRVFQFSSLLHLSEIHFKYLYFVIMIIGAWAYFHLIIKLVSSFLSSSYVSLLTALIWIPFWLLFVYFSTSIPYHDPHDEDSYVSVLFLIVLMIVYPFFIGGACVVGKRKGNVRDQIE
ncbi:MAG: hypothetical protein ACE3JK_09045 [Sporolactobacillus sp.]